MELFDSLLKHYFFFLADLDSAAVRFFFGLPFPRNLAI
jgi:hypothetical protein